MEQQLWPELNIAPKKNVRGLQRGAHAYAHHQQVQRPCSPSRHPRAHTQDPCLRAVTRINRFSSRTSLSRRIALTSRPTPLKPFACAAAWSTARPPATLPVNATKSTSGFCTALVVSSGLRWMTCRASCGTPALWNARAKRSATRGVQCGDRLMITMLPPIEAGRTVLTMAS